MLNMMENKEKRVWRGYFCRTDPFGKDAGTKIRTSNQTTNSATNEHKHPNQYTKGADDESAKNSTSSRSSNAKNSR